LYVFLASFLYLRASVFSPSPEALKPSIFYPTIQNAKTADVSSSRTLLAAPPPDLCLSHPPRPGPYLIVALFPMVVTTCQLTPLNFQLALLHSPLI
jgi:hypothetical protein